MKISTLKYFVVDSIKGLRRHKTLSTASIATVAATLFILGVFILSIMNVKQAVTEVESKVEATIVLKDDIKTEQEKAIKDKINSVAGVEKVTYESKKDALEKFKKQLGENNKSLAEGLEKENPLPNSIIVRVEKPELVSKVVGSIKDMDGIDQIKDGKEIVDKITKITNTLKWMGVVLFLILIGVSLFLIGNTIKITVYSRKREIGIMKYIGATDWFIRWPFVFEGIIIGILGAIIAIVLLYYGYKAAYAKASVGLIFVSLLNPSVVLSSVLWIFVLVGIVIGAIGSILSIRKFLSV
ncbi:ABC transporter permease [Clostridium botulinum]|uniref:Cell division protein FtsX n=1 Tax=Clostridium botulinum TaxID=1491 RepID=A0A6B4U4K1_CLOBO|nr:ABC transporter permease [Clostridium botulinum]NFD83232.1 ABC transporter permease [Clostridium botulinum]NFE07897.1 ABC transporter permease [Clostridium botulinum]NFE34727.1 ABC transporter permease [Clostridium botulinum]NFE48039.1 ABC transporter permease [Clostridium botulinum]